MATLLAKEEGVPYVLAKAQHEYHAAILRKIGADAVVQPELEMGSRVAKNLVSADFADWITLSADYSMAETEVPRRWIGRTLRELDIRQKYGINVVGIMRGKEVEVNPDPGVPLDDESLLILIGRNQDLQKFRKE